MFYRFPCPEIHVLWGLFLLFVGILERLHTVEFVAAYTFSAACLIILQGVSWMHAREDEGEGVDREHTSSCRRSLSASNELISSAFVLTSAERVRSICVTISLT